MSEEVISSQNLRDTVIEAVQSQEVTDIHTHLFNPPFGDLLLWGVDELITYHYLIAETFRKTKISYENFWRMRLHMAKYTGYVLTTAENTHQQILERYY